MSIVRINLDSLYLSGTTQVTVILPSVPKPVPPRDFYESGEKFKVLWLLHGSFQDDTEWVRFTNIELYAKEHNIAVVLPSAMNSDYVNWDCFGLGYHMYDHFFEELMPMIYNWFPISDKREDNVIAGASMGGFGTMVFALNHPEKFSVAASLSGPIMDPHNPVRVSPEKEVPPHIQAFRPNRKENQLANAGGLEGYLKSPANTWDKIVKNVENGVDMPTLFFCCGTDDWIYPAYTHFKEYAEENHVPAIFEEVPGYIHEWRFWDLYIEKVIDRFMK